ncbi:hypothetical protein [Cellulomonas soli]|uniref:Uncharacterized protein n=1 Tax=Cellulomonas soli TaxID=931535 RepID=A0A512PFU3_9CELL|nr:hypothetical protein [Cellulomonas soli]NYI59796.1 hypothetical protein [Cellulomonas soli]GEP70061.1 hypothetical protein CSO01_27760 [Cellulomonas soli]
MNAPSTARPPHEPWRAWAPGVRVVVRRLRRDDDGTLLDAPGEPRYTDVLGDLLVVDETGVLVRTRHGDVHVAGADIALGKIVPPAPVRRPRPRPEDRDDDEDDA